jgi:hypothetical protein
MPIDPTQPEFKHLLDVLRNGLRSIEIHCRRGLVPRDAPAILRQIRGIREVADGLEALSGEIRDPNKPDERFRTLRGTSYEPGDPNKS